MTKMGRGIKVLLCSFCLDRSPDRATSDQSFTQGIDVSHLATSHSSYNLPSAGLREPLSSPIYDQENNDNYSQPYNSPTIANNYTSPPSRATPDRVDGRENSSPIVQDRQQHQSDNNQPLPSPHSSASGSNIYEQSQDEHQIPNNNHDAQNPQQPPQQPQQQIHYNHHQIGQNDNNGTSTKLSYDIISVREPLAKILAERQLLHQAQLQQRQILGDHEYNEVYGERGSSCFYEEIAGSTTSSATYDQIGSVSNHNYQALINAYAVTNRANRDKTNDNQETERNNQNVVDNSENIYNLTQAPNNDHLHNPQDGIKPIPSTSYNNSLDNNFQNRLDQNNSPGQATDRNVVVSESVPVYSVINKATRRNNPIRSTMDNCRPPPPPPPPPPKNPLAINNQQPSTSAIPHYQQSSVLMSNRSNSSQIPTPSSSLAFRNGIDNNNDDNSEHRENENRLPQPPPRYSKHPMFDATKRPLPLPDNHQILNNNNINLNGDDDSESLNNGYELLTNANFNDDVGYEKIRETHQYSGGSISSQFNPLNLLDNEGYESIQPIYSSPSNALVEPNYEAIGPATASELAAAATARLTAAAAVIDYLNQDQT